MVGRDRAVCWRSQLHRPSVDRFGPAGGRAEVINHRAGRVERAVVVLELIDQAVPKGLDLHLFLDSYATHKTPDEITHYPIPTGQVL